MAIEVAPRLVPGPASPAFDRAAWASDLVAMPVGVALAELQRTQPAAYTALLASLDEVEVRNVDPKLTVAELRAIVSARRRALAWADAHHVSRAALFAAWDAPDLRPVSALSDDAFVGTLDFNLGFSVRTPIIAELQTLMASDPLAAFDLIQRARDAGIVCWRRFGSLGALASILAARTPDARPVALVIAPRSDWNGAFNAMADGLAALMGTYRVVYVEAGSVSQALAASATALAGARADLVVFGGHGNDSSVALGVERDDASLLDLTDAEELAALRTLCADNAHVLLWACSSAANGRGSIADYVARTTGLRTTGATAPYGFDYIDRPAARRPEAVALPHGLSAVAYAGMSAPPVTYAARLSAPPSRLTERGWARRRYPRLPTVTLRPGSPQATAALLEALRLTGVPVRTSGDGGADSLPIVTIGRRAFAGAVPALFDYIESFRPRRRSE